MTWVSRACGVCGASRSREFLPARLPESGEAIEAAFWSHYLAESRRRSHGPLVRCLGCGHVYASPYLSPELLDRLYRSAPADNSWGLARDSLRPTFRRYLAPTLPHVPERALAVDVGCDAGLMLDAFREAGFRRVVGVEPSPRAAGALAAARSDGIELIEGVYREESFPAGSVSLLSFIHVLDHLVEPLESLSIARKHLADDGILTAVTHDISSWLARLSGRGFPALTLQHPHYFSKRSLSLLFERAGFRVLALVRTTNDYPLHHLASFAPGVPEAWRSALVGRLARTRWGRTPIRLPLGNIQLVARRR